MTAQILDRVLTCYRIGDPDGEFPIFDATGSTLAPGRWNTSSSPMVYASEHFSTAMLEKLAHGGGQIPPNQHYIQITISSGLSYEVFSEAGVPGWADEDGGASRVYGDKWHQDRRSLILVVPSVVARIDKNILVNPNHPEFGRITHSLHQPVWWDSRLFGSPP